MDSFRNFAYVSSYLRLNSFSRKGDYVISQKSTNATDFIESIPERSQKVLLETCNLTAPQRPFLLEVLEFYATKNV